MKKINKIQVSIKQLKKAIRLYFKRDDPIVIHSLVAPAHQILFDLNKHLGEPESMLKKKGNYKTINFPYNFIKHADNDPESFIYMNEETWQEFLEMFLIDATLLLINLMEYKEILIEAKIYFSWYSSKYKEKFLDISKNDAFANIQSLNIGEWDFVEISQFFKFFDVCGEEIQKHA